MTILKRMKIKAIKRLLGGLLVGLFRAIMFGIAGFSFAVSLVNFLVLKKGALVQPSLQCIISISILWQRDVIRESKGGYHTVIGYLLFNILVIMLFVSQYWVFLHSSLTLYRIESYFASGRRRIGYFARKNESYERSPLGGDMRLWKSSCNRRSNKTITGCGHE